jgi:hypothetical protein
MGDVDLDSASTSEALPTGSSGNRSSADYKMLIAKADALLEQFALHGTGLHS